jgi:hypothetical protein
MGGFLLCCIRAFAGLAACYPLLKDGKVINEIYLDDPEVIMLDIALAKAINLLSPNAIDRENDIFGRLACDLSAGCVTRKEDCNCISSRNERD